MITKNEIKFKIGDIVWFWEVEPMADGTNDWRLVCSSIEYFIIHEAGRKYIEYHVNGFHGYFDDKENDADNVLHPSFEHAMGSDPR